jgi:FixJ family two-component response regulator
MSKSIAQEILTAKRVLDSGTDAFPIPRSFPDRACRRSFIGSPVEVAVLEREASQSPKRIRSSQAPDPRLEALTKIDHPLSRQVIGLLNGITDGIPRTPSEVAKEMGISEEEVRAHAQRGVDQLRCNTTTDES